MNDQLQKALADIINKSMAGIDATKEFLIKETPDVIQQLLLWYGVYKFILFCLGVLLIVCIIIGNYKQVKWLNKNKLWGEPWVTFNMAQALFMVPIVATVNIEWLKIWIAPKIWLIEYASRLVAK